MRAYGLGGLLDVESVRPGCALVGLDTLPCRLQVLSRQRTLQQATCARCRLCQPCVRVLMQRTSGFVTGSLWPGFTAPPPRPPGLPRLLTHDLAALHVFSHSLSFGPSSFGLCLIGHRLELLRPLLTSRSSMRCRPFRHKARSPQVRTHSFIAQPPDLRHFALITRASRFLARSPCLAAPSIRFLFIGSQFMLHASSPHSVTLVQLRFTSLAVINLRRDLHPQECAHAGRTKKSSPRSELSERCERGRSNVRSP